MIHVRRLRTKLPKHLPGIEPTPESETLTTIPRRRLVLHYFRHVRFFTSLTFPVYTDFPRILLFQYTGKVSDVKNLVWGYLVISTAISKRQFMSEIISYKKTSWHQVPMILTCYAFCSYLTGRALAWFILFFSCFVVQCTIYYSITSYFNSSRAFSIVTRDCTE